MADPAQTSLEHGLNDPDRFRRFAAVRGLAPELAWSYLFKMRNDPFAPIRAEVIAAIAINNLYGTEADLVIQQYRNDEDHVVRTYAEWIIQNRSGAPPQSLNWLLEQHLGWWGPTWNMSRDDPWWRQWLLSRELFCSYQQLIQCHGIVICKLLNGTIFENDSKQSCRVFVWLSADEIVAGYGHGDWNIELSQAFEVCVEHLRNSPPLELGQIRDGFSYAASLSEGSLYPIVKWAQGGDWAAMVRNWHCRRL